MGETAQFIKGDIIEGFPNRWKAEVISRQENMFCFVFFLVRYEVTSQKSFSSAFESSFLDKC